MAHRSAADDALGNRMLLSCLLTIPRGRHIRMIQEKDAAERSATAKTIFLWASEGEDLLACVRYRPDTGLACESFLMRGTIYSNAHQFLLYAGERVDPSGRVHPIETAVPARGQRRPQIGISLTSSGRSPARSFCLLSSALSSRRSIQSGQRAAVESLCLRQQLLVLQYRPPQPLLRNAQFWICASRWLAAWHNSLLSAAKLRPPGGRAGALSPCDGVQAIPRADGRGIPPGQLADGYCPVWFR